MFSDLPRIEQITTPRNGPLREETPQTSLRMVLLQKSPVNPIFIKNPETLWGGQKIVAAHCRLFQSFRMSRLPKPGVLYPPCVFYSPFESVNKRNRDFSSIEHQCRRCAEDTTGQTFARRLRGPSSDPGVQRGFCADSP